ncbi:hypothetical protein I3760_03G080700 [Carya illinoinensis]|uniref:Uncharacterized protein n=1 Tax=Carya illinoinensis TaxID=32201 RepID=A0A8T1R046_CARIL|nr:hypothetical protein I3760_03G080700 [Carya illinoinensis]KAG6660166.1 hypothetical protein CIPAW_03G087100 [Carya illinoinensis]
MGKKEMGTELKKVRLVACFAVLLLISLGTNPSAAASTFDGNKILSRIDATIAEEVQPLMESEVNRRFLQTNTPTYRTQGRGPVCNATLYGNCLIPLNGKSERCTVYNRCQRGGSQL